MSDSLEKEVMGGLVHSMPEHGSDDGQGLVDIGPGSILWNTVGERRNMITAIPGGLLQLMHPEVGAGVLEHSNFFGDPWKRVFNSIPLILGTIYDEDPDRTGRKVRDIHKRIHGIDNKGRPYDALKAETFWWTHASFTVMVEDAIDRLTDKPLTPDRQELLYQESKAWYARYGISARPVPPDRQAFQEKWDSICANVLEMTPAAEQTLERIREGDMGRIPSIPPAVWKVTHKLISEQVRLLTIGGLPETVRERFDIPFSSADKRRLERLDASVRIATRLAPSRFRYFPRAREGMQRVNQQIAA